MIKNKNKYKIVLIVSFILCMTVFSDASASGMSKSEIIKLVNNSRAEKGIFPLKENNLLSDAAKAKVNDMIKNDYFAHTSPSGKDPWHWLRKIGYKYELAGENLAINYDDAKEQHAAWMKSPTHKKNIMNSSYSEIGVAILDGKIDGEKSLIAVQFFGTPIAIVSAIKKEPVIENPEPITKKAPEVLSVIDQNLVIIREKETVFKPEEKINNQIYIGLENKNNLEGFINKSYLYTLGIITSVFIVNIIIIFSEGAIRVQKNLNKKTYIEIIQDEKEFNKKRLNMTIEEILQNHNLIKKTGSRPG